MKSRKKSICTMSKKEESLSGKIKLMIDEQMDILNDDIFNQKLESLSRRVEQVQCRKNHEEIAKAFLKKISKLERHINAVIAFQEEVAAHQTILPSPDYEKPVLNQLGPSAFYPDIINIPINSSNTLLLSPNTGFTSACVSGYISSDEVILVSMENQNSANENNSAIPNNQMSTQAEIPATVQSEMKERKRKVIKLTEEENHNCSKVSLNDNLTGLNGSNLPVSRNFHLVDCFVKTFKQFPHLPPLPRIPHCPELTEEFKDSPQNPET